MMTASGGSPSFVLEAQSRAHKDGSIDYFAEKIGRGLRHNLVFLYISRCCPVGLITTEPKIPPILQMELADFVAFAVRRYFYCDFIKKAPEFPLARFGRIHWGSFAPAGFGTISATGFPMDFFFPGSNWPPFPFPLPSR